MERDIEKDLIEIECAIKSQKEKDNIFTMSVLQRCYKLVSQLKEYKDLEEQNKLLKLPCAVGDTVWFIKSNFSYMKNPKAEKVRKIEIIDGEIIFRTENRCFEMKRIGKTVFLTREEAEAASKELEGRNETD